MTNRPDTRPPTNPTTSSSTVAADTRQATNPDGPEHQHPESPTAAPAVGPSGLRPTLRLLLAAGHSLADLNAAGRAPQQHRQSAAPGGPADEPER